MLEIKYCLLILLGLRVEEAACTLDEPQVTFEQLYQYAKSEYSNGNWPDCIAFFLRALEDFNYYLDEVVWCRQKCANEYSNYRQTDLQQARGEIHEIAEMYANAQRALCLFRCKNDRLTSMRPPIKNPIIFDEFQGRKPYEYMQICYWKQNDLASAVRSAYTFLVANPSDQQTLDNLAFYMEQKDFDRMMLVDSLQMKYEKSYMHGVEAYNSGDWEQCVTELRNSIEDFYEEENKCRRICEDQLNWETLDGYNPEISIAVASVYLSVLRCRNECSKKLSRVNGHDVGSILSSYFEYLHVCHYKLSHGSEACQAVANSILLNPKNPIMRRNRLFYSKIYGKNQLFLPSDVNINMIIKIYLDQMVFSALRNDVIEYHKRDAIEKLFLEFVDQKFKFVNNELVPGSADDRKQLDLSVPIDDDFDYSLIEREILSPAECSTLGIAAVFETWTVNQKKQLVRITERIAERYRTPAVLYSLSCTQDEPVVSKCKKHTLVISIDHATCGTFFGEPQSHSCSIIYCVG